MLQNKRFQSNETQEIVTVMADNGVFYNLSNGANIKKDIFFQKYSEMVDATNFFQQQSAAGLSSLAEQIKTVDSRNAVDGNVAPRVKYIQESMSSQEAAPPEYREMLLRRYEQEQAHKDLSQYKMYENDDDAVADFERRNKQAPPPPRPRPQPPQQYQEQYQEQQPYQQPPQAPQQPYQEPQYQQQVDTTPSYVSPEEESFKFFKSFNKIYPIRLSVDFDEKIAEPGFIKMMAMNYKGDIIKFYTKEFMNRIYNDPGFLENKIYDKLREIVFTEGEKKEKKPRAPKAIKTPEVTKKPNPAPKKKITIPPVPKQDRERLGPGVE